MVINFADGSTSSPITFAAPDWYNNPGSALAAFGRILAGLYDPFFTEDPPEPNPNLYHSIVDLASKGLNTKAIGSVTFTMPSNAGNTGVFALSGTLKGTGTDPRATLP